MDSQTVKLQRRGPGRPKVRDTETTTLNLDRKVMALLREMSKRYGMPVNHIIENLVLSAVNEDYPLRVAEENSQLKRRVVEYEKRIRELESELERIRVQCENENDNTEIREIMRLKEDSHRILDRYGELKVFELVMRLFNVQPGERLQHLVKRFVEDYFVNTGDKELISRELRLKIIKNSNTSAMGWIVRKLEDA
ncbi:hypothetical protein [Thermococcus sp.]